VLENWRGEFPGLVSYSRFVEFIPSALIPLTVFLREKGLGACSGISFIDSTPIAVCHNARIHQNKVFAGVAQRGHTSTGWFYGFKLHLVVNDRGDLLSVLLTPGNVDDRKPVPLLVQELFGKLFGDKGYLSAPLSEQLREVFQVQLITKLRDNMKNKLLLFADALILRKRSIIETIIDQLKNISQIEHSRHRSVMNFVVNVLCGLIAYSRRPKKPSLGFGQLACLPA
jgi:transposase